MSDRTNPSVTSPRKKLATPVKVHLMHHKGSGEGFEEKRDDGQEEKTTAQSSVGRPTTAASLPASKSKRTPVKQALQSAVGLANQGRFLDAVHELDRAMEMYLELKGNVRLHMNRGTYHFRAGLYEESLADFERAAALDDGLASLHFNRGNVFKALHRYDDALKSYQRATEIDPKLADAHAGVAHMLMRQKKFRQALASASRALEVSPAHFSALDAKMKCLARLGRTLEAVDSVKALIKCYEQLAKVSAGTLDAVPEEHRKAFSRILCHAAIKVPASDSSGLELAREAFSLDPCYDACFELANQLFSRGMHEEAAAAFKRSGELEPTRSEPPLLESVCWIQLGKFEKALAPLRRASKMQDNQKEVRFYTGLALLNLGRFSEAIPPLRRVVDADPESDDEIIEKGRFLLASAYVHAGEEERAFELLQVARRAQRGSRDPEVHFQAGYAASLLARDADAKDCLQHCLEIDPNHQRAREALRNIAEKEKAINKHRPPSPPPLPPPPLSLIIPPDDRPIPPRGPPPTPPAEGKVAGRVATNEPQVFQSIGEAARRQQTSKPLETMQPWVEAALPAISGHGTVSAPTASQDSLSPRVAALRMGSGSQVSPRGSTGKPLEVSKRSYQKLSHLGVMSGAAAARQAKSATVFSSVAKLAVSDTTIAGSHPSSQATPVLKPPQIDRFPETEPTPKPSNDQNSSAMSAEPVALHEPSPTPPVIVVKTEPVQAQSSAPAKTKPPSGPIVPQRRPVESKALVDPIPKLSGGFGTDPLSNQDAHAIKKTETSEASLNIENDSQLSSLGAQALANEATSVPSVATSVRGEVEPLKQAQTPVNIANIQPSSTAIAPKSPPESAFREAAAAPNNPTASLEQDKEFPNAGVRALPPPLPSRRPVVSARSKLMRPKSESAHVPSSAEMPAGLRALKAKSNSADLIDSATILSPLSSKLSPDVQVMIRTLFGPPEGEEGDVQLVTRVFAEEGIERMADVELLTLQDLEALPSLKRAWCRRILNYAMQRKASNPTGSAELVSIQGSLGTAIPRVETSSTARASGNPLIKGLEGFDLKALRKPEIRPHVIESDPRAKAPTGFPMDELMLTIKTFPKSKLRTVEAKKPAPKAPSDASGFLSTLVNAMRSRRVLLDDFDFDGGRKAAPSDVDNDDMYEADWS